MRGCETVLLVLEFGGGGEARSLRRRNSEGQASSCSCLWRASVLPLYTVQLHLASMEDLRSKSHRHTPVIKFTIMDCASKHRQSRQNLAPISPNLAGATSALQGPRVSWHVFNSSAYTGQ